MLESKGWTSSLGNREQGFWRALLDSGLYVSTLGMKSSFLNKVLLVFLPTTSLNTFFSKTFEILESEIGFLLPIRREDRAFFKLMPAEV